jgi:8-oxo-dGTP pyrophosphatase MutT (NUDIX family)
MSDLINNLRTALANRPLPLARCMVPELSYGRHHGPARRESRRASVLLALFDRADQWWLPLTLRHPGMSRHQGQISLPGGLIDPGETSEAAAVREFTEELGGSMSIEVLGRLDNCYVYVSDTLVTPWIARLESSHCWLPNPCEVERVIEMPVALLNDPAARRVTTVCRGPLKFKTPGYAVGEDHVWGATAVMLEQFAALI